MSITKPREVFSLPNVHYAYKYDLPFPLLCDTELKLVQELGVYGEKKMAGRTYMGVYRTTFITDTEGTVTRIIGPKEVKVRAHAEQIL